MKKKIILSVSFLLGLISSCNESVNATEETNMNIISFCDSIAKMSNEYLIEGSNKSMNSIIPLLEQESKINATCSKGTAGFLYFMDDDSIFQNDMKKWKTYFKCD